jgi:hypothetical protein
MSSANVARVISCDWGISDGLILRAKLKLRRELLLNTFHAADDVCALLYSCVSLIYIHCQTRKLSRHFDAAISTFPKSNFTSYET